MQPMYNVAVVFKVEYDKIASSAIGTNSGAELLLVNLGVPFAERIDQFEESEKSPTYSKESRRDRMLMHEL